MVEHSLGKGEVESSILSRSTINKLLIFKALGENHFPQTVTPDLFGEAWGKQTMRFRHFRRLYIAPVPGTAYLLQFGAKAT